MRIECEDNGRARDLHRRGLQPFDNSRVPLVNAVEVANRHRSATELGRQISKLSIQFHFVNYTDRSRFRTLFCLTYRTFSCPQGQRTRRDFAPQYAILVTMIDERTRVNALDGRKAVFPVA